GLIQLMATLLVALPLLGVFGKDAGAASSRIAVIKELSGDVKVRKAGGSKAFRAFAKLSLNQGDILTTGEKGSATLQFSNGTSEDDQMTVAANTTLTFSKLSNKKGSVTKVSMLKGTVWSDVKSIRNKDDEFQLETPTAVMGVRGTHFLSAVDPNTSATNLTVFAGVVRANVPQAGQLAIAGSSSGAVGGMMPAAPTGPNGPIGPNRPNGLGQTVLVYPSQQIYLPGTLPPAADLNGQVGIVDVGSLIGTAPPEVIQALVTNLSAIKEEQEEQKKKLQENPGGIASGLETLGQIAENIDSLLPGLLKEAIDQGKLGQQTVDSAIQKTKNETGYTIGLDKTVGLDPEQQKRQEELKQQQAREAREAQQKQEDKQAELQRQLGELMKQLQEQMQQIEAANRLAQQAAQAAAEAELKKKLTDEEKAKFEQNKQQNEQGAGTSTPSPSTSSGSSKSSNANLQSLGLSAGTLTPAFDAKTTSYAASVGSEVFAVDVIPVAASNKATLTVNGSALTGGKASVPLAPGTTTAISVKVKAEDGSIKEYKIAVARAATPPSGTATLQSLTLSAGTLSPGFAPETTAYKASVPSATGSVTVKAAATDSNAAVRVNGEPLTADGRAVTLGYGANTVNVEVTAQDGTTKKTYTVEITRQLLNAVKIAFPSGSPLQIDFTSANPNTEFEVPAGSDSLDLTVPSGGPELTVVANGSPVTPEPVSAAGLKAMAAVALSVPSAWKYAIPLVPGSNEIKLTAVIDGVSKTYMILAIKPATNVATLKSLSVDGAELAGFASNKFEYELSVPNEKTSVVVSAEATVAGAGVKVNAPDVLAVGANAVTVVVTAKDGVTTKTYTITVIRSEPAVSRVAKLSSLSLTSGELSPVFHPDTENYEATVSSDVPSIGVKPAIETVGTIKVNDQAVESGQSVNIPLNVGPNTVTIVVTAQDGATTKTYTVAVTRAVPPAMARLSALTVEGGELSPAFDPDIGSYAVRAGYGTEEIVVTPTVKAGGTMTVNGSASSSGASHTVPLAVGVTTITIVVRAQDGTDTMTYSIVATREAAPGPALSKLRLLNMSRDFEYKAYAPVDGNETMTYYPTVTTTASDMAGPLGGSPFWIELAASGADAVTFNGASYSDVSLPMILYKNETASYPIVLSSAEGTKTYTLTFDLPLDTNYLKRLQADGTEIGAYDMLHQTEFAVDAPNGATEVSLVALPLDERSAVSVNGEAWTPSAEAAPVGWNSDRNIVVEVTPRDGSAARTYTIHVNELPAEGGGGLGEPGAHDIDFFGAEGNLGFAFDPEDPGTYRGTLVLGDSGNQVDVEVAANSNADVKLSFNGAEWNPMTYVGDGVWKLTYTLEENLNSFLIQVLNPERIETPSYYEYTLKYGAGTGSDSDATLSDIKLAEGESYGEDRLLDFSFDPNNRRQKIHIGGIDEKLALKLTKSNPDASVVSVMLNGEEIEALDGVYVLPLAPETEPAMLVRLKSANQALQQTYELSFVRDDPWAPKPKHLDVSQSAATGNSQPLEWTFTSADRFYTDLDMDTFEVGYDGISLGFLPDSGYGVAYEPENGNVTDGVWEGISTGLNHLAVTVYEGESLATATYKRTYHFYAYLGEPFLEYNEDGTEGAPIRQYGVPYDGTTYFEIPASSWGVAYSFYSGDDGAELTFPIQTPDSGSEFRNGLYAIDPITGREFNHSVRIHFGESGTAPEVAFDRDDWIEASPIASRNYPGAQFFYYPTSLLYDLRIIGEAGVTDVEAYTMEDEPLPGKVYDPDTRTWMWTDREVPGHGDVLTELLKVKVTGDGFATVYYVKLMAPPL
ncbi:cadherin-like beta sandwich domain-containing protein, partial [Cohnella xylanilytica]|uniref:cadherin-like beta sandwich domain-containing protein n=1 Tax=Cohnella xylanilytica TaxID=557555 RepID=UPI001BB3E986